MTSTKMKPQTSRWGNCQVCNTALPWPKEEGEEFRCCWYSWVVVEYNGKLVWEEGSLPSFDDEQ